MQTLTPTQQAFRDTASKLMNFVCNNDRILYLKGRWLDEREYEDFAGYEKALKAAFEGSEFNLLKATKSFDLTVQAGDFRYVVRVNTTCVKIKKAA